MTLPDLISDQDVSRAMLFLVCSIVGMVYGYYRRWSYGEHTVSFITYSTGDSKAIGRAFTTLFALVFTAGGFDYLDHLTLSQIVGAGIGLGLLVPETVDKKYHKE